MAEDPTPYIQEAEDRITNPAVCIVSGEELELSNGELVYLNDNYRPVSDQYKEQARFIASVHHACGSPWNGIHPETGETQSLDSTSWWSLNDIKPL